MQKAYVDFAMDCFRLQAEIQSNPEQPETSHMQPHSQTYGTGGGPGGIAFSDSAPGGFRFLSPCRKEQRDSNAQHGYVRISIMCGSVTRWLPQPLRGSSLPEGASVHAKVAGPYRLRGTPTVGFAATSLREGGSVHAWATEPYRPPGTPTVGFHRAERNNATQTNSLGMFIIPAILTFLWTTAPKPFIIEAHEAKGMIPCA